MTDEGLPEGVITVRAAAHMPQADGTHKVVLVEGNETIQEDVFETESEAQALVEAWTQRGETYV